MFSNLSLESVYKKLSAQHDGRADERIYFAAITVVALYHRRNEPRQCLVAYRKTILPELSAFAVHRRRPFLDTRFIDGAHVVFSEIPFVREECKKGFDTCARVRRTNRIDRDTKYCKKTSSPYYGVRTNSRRPVVEIAFYTIHSVRILLIVLAVTENTVNVYTSDTGNSAPGRIFLVPLTGRDGKPIIAEARTYRSTIM